MLEIIDCEQGTDEWLRHRMKIPTASEFSVVLARGKNGAPSKTRATYMRKLAGEIICDEPMESYSNKAMERGKLLEPDIRNLYCMMAKCDVRRVGFLRNGRRGASPDGLIGNDGMLEIKSEAPHLLIETMFADELPPEHYAQLQGGLLISEREWIDLAVGYKKMPLFTKRTGRDEPYIKILNDEIDRFNEELDALVRRVKAYGGS